MSSACRRSRSTTRSTECRRPPCSNPGPGRRPGTSGSRSRRHAGSRIWRGSRWTRRRNRWRFSTEPHGARHQARSGAVPIAAQPAAPRRLSPAPPGRRPRTDSRGRARTLGEPAHAGHGVGGRGCRGRGARCHTPGALRGVGRRRPLARVGTGRARSRSGRTGSRENLRAATDALAAGLAAAPAVADRAALGLAVIAEMAALVGD